MPRKGLGRSTSPVAILNSSSESESVYLDESAEQQHNSVSPYAQQLKTSKHNGNSNNNSNSTESERYDLTALQQDDLLGPRSYTIDPFEFMGGDIIVVHRSKENGAQNPDDQNGDRRQPQEHQPFEGDSSLESGSPYHLSSSGNKKIHVSRKHANASPGTFIIPSDIHPHMESNQDDIARLRLLAGPLFIHNNPNTTFAPALARRIRDFQFAQEKRRCMYGDERPWGILGVYEHLSSIRIDVGWAEDAAQRRANGEPYQSWADYEASKKTGRHRPYCTYVLLLVCSGIMVASIAVNGWTVEPLNVNPMVGPSAETLIWMGAKESRKIVVDRDGWRLLTSSVLHAGLVHYVINMLALWFVGAAIEMSHGWFAALLIFTLSAVGGSILSALFLPQAISVGASGGIFGFIGACLADIIMNWRLLFCDIVNQKNSSNHRHAIVVVFLLFDIVLNSIIGLTPYIDNYNHLGGMMYGFLCGLSTMNRLSVDFFGIEESWMHHAKQFITRFFGVIFSIAAIVTTLIILLNGDATTTPCPGCTWLSCVSFPPWEPKDNKWWYCDDCGRVTADVETEPSLHLELHCPSGLLAEVPLDSTVLFDRDRVQQRLPTYCRQYCKNDDDGEDGRTLWN